MKTGLGAGRRRRTAGAILATAALGVSAFALSGAPAGAASAKGKTATVKIQNFAYNKKTLKVAKGTTVTFVNKDSAPHTATDKGVFNTKTLNRNKKKAITFKKKGTFKYICTIHPFMHGKIVVG
jgi:plastocyanin